MEEERHWMWAKSKVEADSWEEQAFAEDAAGVLGGCVWPPRSYSCSFCRRDFRSAQALGGHMNVHRRDKARLKQSPNPAASEVEVALSPCTSSYSSQMCTSFLFNNPNPNPEFSDSSPFASRLIRAPSPPSPAAAKVHNSHEKVSSTLRFFTRNYVQKSDQGSLVSLDHPPSWPGTLSEKRDCAREDLSMSLNLLGCESPRNKCGEEEVGSFKRRRMKAKPLSTFLPRLRSAVERCLPQVQPEVLKLCSAASTSAAAAEDLDLELRLGYAPKVK